MSRFGVLERPTHQVPISVTAVPPKVEAPAKVPWQDRAGKAMVGGHFTVDLSLVVKALATGQGMTLQALVGEVLDDLLRKHCKHPLGWRYKAERTIMMIPAWPVGSGDMVQLIRAHDWAATPLGAREHWPGELRYAVDMVLASPLVSSVVVGVDRVLLYNDAAAALYGDNHPRALGRPVAETWPEAWTVVSHYYDRVFKGESVHVPAQALDVERPGAGQVFEAYLTPVRAAAGTVIAAHMTGFEIGARIRAETALSSNVERQALLLKLGDTIRTISDPATIQLTAMQLLGEHLGLSRAYYFGVERENGGWVHVIDWAYQREPDGPSMVGRHALADFGDGMFEGFARGEVIAVADVSALAHVTPEELASYRALGVTAFIKVPLLRNGEYSAGIGAHDTDPHAWTQAEIDLIREVAARAWTAVERARAEAALRSSEELRRIALESGRLGAWRWDTQSRLVWGDWTFQALFGLSPEDGPHPIEAYMRQKTQGDIEVIDGVMATVIKPGEEFEQELKLASGRWIRWRGRAETDKPWIINGVSFDVTERKQERERLRESEARLTLAFKTLPIGIAVVDAAGDTTMANDEMLRFLPTGRIPSHDPGRIARWRGWDANGEIVRSEDFPSARALRGETVPPGMQMLYRDDSGAEIWTEVLSAPLPDGDGQINGAISVVVDVNRIKRSEEAARASEERLRQFGEASQDILWIRDADTLQWVYLTPAFEAIYGLSREAALTGDNYRTWLDLIVPEDRTRALASINRVAAGERVTFEYRVRRPVDGRLRWLRNTDFPMLDKTGRVTRIGGVGHDVTELKAAQAAMVESETRLRTLMEGIPQLVWRSCDKGLWTWCSPQWMAFTGQSQDASHGWDWLEVVHPDDRPAAIQAWEQAQLHGRLDVEHRVQRASDGAWLWHRTRSVPVRDAPGPDGAEGRIVEWLGTTTDIDDLKRLQGEQQVLVAELQHRTRNLLAVVRTVARRSIGPSPERDDYDARLAAIGRVQGFLSRSPGYSVPLGDVVEAELHAVGDTASNKVEIVGPVIELPGESVQVVALALHELATNAVKYGAIAQPSGRLSVTWHVEAQADTQSLVIDWHESGVAMPPGPSARRGYGTELITRALPYQLRAETALDFRPDGVRCRIILPASAFESRMRGDFA